MKITIKTGARVTDSDIRALYLLVYAMQTSSDRMKEYNLRYVAERFGYKLVKEDR